MGRAAAGNGAQHAAAASLPAAQAARRRQAADRAGRVPAPRRRARARSNAFSPARRRQERARFGASTAGLDVSAQGALALAHPALAELRNEPFIESEANRLDELRLEALEERIAADLALGRHGELCSELQALVMDNPLREGLRARLMLSLYRSGRQAEALETYAELRDLLQ